MSKEFITVDGNVKKIQKENLTPYKIATVILIREYCNETTKGNTLLIYLFIMYLIVYFFYYIIYILYIF